MPTTGPATRLRRRLLGRADVGAGPWLVQAVRLQGTGRALPPVGAAPPRLAQVAERHGIQGQLLEYAVRSGVDVPGLVERVHAAAARHQRALAELRAALDALSAAGIDALVVKGPALACGPYARPDLRSYVDLDLLVRPTTVRAALTALESHGFRLLDANWPLITARGLHELRVAGPSGGTVDLHWSLDAAAGSCVSPPVSALLARSRKVTAPWGSFRTLSWAESVVHVTSHAADSGGHRLVWVTDLWALLAEPAKGAEAGPVLAAAREWGTLPALQLMVGRAERVLGTPAPLALGDELGRRGAWPVLVRLLDRSAPGEDVREGGSLSRLLGRSARRTSLASCGATLGKSALWLMHRGAPPPSAADLLDPQHPESPIRQVGGAAERDRFLDEVGQRAVAQGRD